MVMFNSFILLESVKITSKMIKYHMETKNLPSLIGAHMFSVGNKILEERNRFKIIQQMNISDESLVLLCHELQHKFEI
jgi:hypothetical protein